MNRAPDEPRFSGNEPRFSGKKCRAPQEVGAWQNVLRCSGNEWFGEERMTLFKRTALVAALLPLFTPLSWGLGLGDITMKSYLNEPLLAEVELLDVQNLSSDDIRIRLATQEDFDRVGVERAYFLTNVRFEVVIANGQGKILLSTEQPLLEPYLDFLVETRWPSGRMLREYTVLVDLPSRAQTVQVASSAKAAVRQDASSSVDTIASEAANTDVRSPSPKTSSPRPQRNYDRDAADQPAPGGSYLVQANDTLWDIAVAARPEGKTVEQTMVATVNMNGDAFTGANINGLKAGYVLELPSEADILFSSSEAINEVAAQNRDWVNGVRRTRALRVVADNEFDEVAEESAREDRVQTSDNDLSTAPETDAVNVDAGLGQPALDEDSLPGATIPEAIENQELAVSSNPELAAIQERLGQLSEQVGSLRQLVSVKDQQIAALQAELEARDAQAAAAAEVGAVPVEPAVASQPVPVSESGFPWWVYALGGVVVIAIGGVVYARRVDQRFHASGSGLTESQRNPVARKEPVPAADDTELLVKAPEEKQESERGYGRSLHNDYADDNAVSDAIAEADIYVAYGRFNQALTLLESVAANDEHDGTVYAKMIEVYLQCDRVEEAEALITKIEQTHDMDALKRAMDLLAAHQPHADGVDLGELADGQIKGSSPSTASSESVPEAAAAGLDFELVANKDDTAAARDEADFELELNFDEDSNASATHTQEPGELSISADELGTELPDLGTADWGDMSSMTPAENDRLPPELAEVLGSDVPPPPVSEVERSDDDALIYAQETDPMDTKLDLARAYIDMGDEDGARPVLEEVIAGGDLQQQAEARELLIRID